MIKIQFKMFTSFLEIEDDYLNGEYGYFQFCIDGQCYGEYREDIELDILSTNIYGWFSYFIQAMCLLRNNSIVYISDTDTSEVWIKLVVDEEAIQISEICAEKPEGSYSVETDINLNEKSIAWKRAVKAANFQKELVFKGEQYLAALKRLNQKANKKIEKLEIQLKEIK